MDKAKIKQHRDMKLLGRIKSILNKPFPETESWPAFFRNVTVISLFVAFFLFIFQPFGIATIESGRLLICLGFGLMTFLASTIYEWVINLLQRLRSRTPTFTFGRWMLYMIGIMLAISLANFLYARLLFFGDIRWELFPHMIYGTFMVGFFPILVLGLLSLMRQEQKYQAIASEINQKPLTPPSQNGTLRLFEIPVDRIRYVEALQNYARIGYLNAQGQLEEQTERATLKHIQQLAEGSPILRCHRSFMVNRNAITDTSGNAQGLLLTLSDCEKEVPVSRSYVPVFRDD